ncbi:hypothetical protein Mp_3g15940 [Marchantia polymorpha subsp. ruderalis]|uniref:Uncharacterized protein n=2 Tax=Marchantia polymorpha TaxID=3197 RepID=A0AAF6B1A4_MARPO|nr:hypothetical protein MARPO_0004s0077 [Marchantia polymorpha]BBN05788.1 hypothetical protein Mp_3g15940 [Marchantia polymorpha subsp. ruderalis]|eukprot:PTQ48790.1 hypothetical protein MARPO_0004s0077 [Marchantia polymorpha]
MYSCYNLHGTYFGPCRFPGGCSGLILVCGSLAQFGAILGPKAWHYVARELRKVLALGVPFGPGWVREQEAPLQVKKQHAAKSTANVMTTDEAPAGLVVSPGAPSHRFSSAAASCTSPGNSSAVPLKVTSQAVVDRPPSGKTGQVYSSGALGRPFISSSKTPSGSASVSNVG